MTLKREAIKTDAAPEAIGPYSQAISANGFVFTSGQVSIDPAKGEFVAGSIEEQTEQVLKNIQAVLEAAGSSMERVIKTTVFLSDIGDFARMNAVYSRFFSAPFPARAAVQAARLPKGAKIMIDAVALAP